MRNPEIVTLLFESGNIVPSSEFAVRRLHEYEVIELMRSQNTASRFDEIYGSTSKAVLTYITAKCGRVADINDIFQDTYLELYHLLIKRGTDYVTNETALVMKIARQNVSKYYTLKERLRIFVSLSPKEDGAEAGISEQEADAFVTEEFVVDKIMLESARSLIERKPEVTRKVFYLFYDLGLTIPEISKELSISESSVKNKLYRTLKELRVLLNAKEEQSK